MTKFVNINDGDVLEPGALILAGREAEGGEDNLVGIEHTLGKVPEQGSHNAVTDAHGLIVVSVPPTELLQPQLPLLGLIPTTGCVTLLLTAGNDSKCFCNHNFKSSRRDGLSPEIAGKGIGA